MYKIKNLFLRNVVYAVMVILVFVFACKRSNSEPKNTITPTSIHLKVDIQIVGQSSAYPNGDGSGVVNFILSADNATSYKIIYTTQNQLLGTLNASQGTINYTFIGNNGTTTYPIQIKVYNGSISNDTTIFLQIYYAPNMVKADVNIYQTIESQSLWFAPIAINYNQLSNTGSTTITISPKTAYQEIDGFGAAITGSSAYNLNKMSATNRDKLLKELFDTTNGMGWSFVRVSIGCSDFSLSEFTWWDNQGASIAISSEDANYVIPILKQILQINPNLKILGSPWSPPIWMKVNNLTSLQSYPSWTSGQLNTPYYNDYANYFVKWIEFMQLQGIPIYAITIQNEPLNRGNSASMYMTWQEQRDFVKNNLGPAFEAAGIKTKIIIYDHNYNYDNIADQKNYVTNIYLDPNAAKYIDGSAWHAYGGDKSELLTVHNINPNKNIYFTEMSIGTWATPSVMWDMEQLGIGTLNNFSKSVIVWNLLLDNTHGPYRPGGCNTCFGTIDINKNDYTMLTRNSHYYLISHLAKVIKTGAIRIKISGMPSGIYAIAAKNREGSYGAVLQNTNTSNQNITLVEGTHNIIYTLPARSIVSLRWNKSAS